MTGPRDDLVGRQFGRLTVIRLAERRPRDHGITWLVRCNCGRRPEFRCLGDSLKRGRCRSCGCGRGQSRIDNKIGNRYSRLVVITRDDGRTRKLGRVYWLCQCDCGELTSVESGNLRVTRSCGCWRKDRPTVMATQRKLAFSINASPG